MPGLCLAPRNRNRAPVGSVLRAVLGTATARRLGKEGQGCMVLAWARSEVWKAEP